MVLQDHFTTAHGTSSPRMGPHLDETGSFYTIQPLRRQKKNCGNFPLGPDLPVRKVNDAPTLTFIRQVQKLDGPLRMCPNPQNAYGSMDPWIYQKHPRKQGPKITISERRLEKSQKIFFKEHIFKYLINQYDAIRPPESGQKKHFLKFVMIQSVPPRL